jgi:tetratricopeptide (TPR) repeat protein
MIMNMSENVYSEIVKLSKDGNALFDCNELQKAKVKYIKALDLVPNPKSDWTTATWLYTTLGDICFLEQAYEEAINYLFDAVNCPDALENPFIMLRLGESLFETGADINRVRDYLMRAYMLGGKKIFENENDKYFKLIKDIIG